MTTLEKLTHEDGIFSNVRLIEGCMVGISQTLADAGKELGKAQEYLRLWQQMADRLVKHIPGVSDQDCKVIAAYESLKEKTK